jgi:alanine or glycine:cation symporter, AGCS family
VSINDVIVMFVDYLWGWPLIIATLVFGVAATVATCFVQVRYFFTAWRLLLFPKKSKQAVKDEALTPLQAFLGALGTSVGNGNIAGIATGIALGGPGAAFWVLFAGFVGMAIRFAEVFLGVCFGKKTFRGVQGGPVVYLSMLPGGSFTPYVFSVLFLLYALTSGNAMQANAIGLGICRTWHINPFVVATGMLLFLVYAVFGGAKRIIRISDMLTPFKVLAFFLSAIIVLGYHYQMIIPTLKLILSSAFSHTAFAGGMLGFSLQAIMRNGLARALNATEAGLGVAASFFGAAGSDKPLREAVMSMVGVFISSFVVCFAVAMIVLASGVWASGEQSTALAISAYETVFGAYGGWVVTFVSASFGFGVMIAFLFIGRTGWLFLTNNRYKNLFYVVFCAVAFLGTIAPVHMIWHVNDLVNGALFLLNMYAIVAYFPLLYRTMMEQKRNNAL